MIKLNLIYSQGYVNSSSTQIMGVNNDLYCKVKSDLRMFQKITSTLFNNKENVIIMGYNTWLSIGKPLNNRMNIVISQEHQDELSSIDGITNFKDFEECYYYLTENENDFGKIFIIGGAQLLEYTVKKYFDSIDLIYRTSFNPINNQNVDQSSISDVSITSINIPIEKYIIEKRINYIKTVDKEEQGEIFDFDKKVYVSKNIVYTEDIYQNSENTMIQEYKYLNLLEDILKNGSKKKSRNSIVYSQFGKSMKFDLREGFPLLTTKKMPWKTILRELLWFIKGSTNNKELQEKKVHIWDANASKEFLESRGLSYEEGDLGPVYGFQWRHFGAKYVDHKTDYTGQGVDQLQWIIDEIKREPTSRRLIMNAWNPVDINKMALPPCHVMVQFNIDGQYIDAQLYQRSGDMFLGVPFNISSYSFLLSIIGKLTNYIPRYLIHVIGDAHIYENHIQPIQEQLLRVPTYSPLLDIINDIQDIDNIIEEDFNILNYNFYPTIKAEMIA
tara:strand:- start:313 stop:1812 length:1500 start_codon:yes stop_codon:yes gene_type:complete